MKKLISAFALLVVVLNATAQMKDNKTPEQRATAVSERMVKNLGISPQQKISVHDLVLKEVEKAQAIKAKASADKKAMRTDLKAVRSEFETELKAILTPDQFTKWTAFKTQMREKRKDKKASGSKADDGGNDMGLN